MRKNYKDTFGANLKMAIRGSSFGTYEKFAEFMQVDRTTVSRWCIGQNLPKEEIIEKIAAALNTTYDALFAEASQSQSESSRIDDLFRELNALKAQIERPAQNVSSLDPELQALFERAAKISPKYRKFLLEQIAMNLKIAEEKTACCLRERFLAPNKSKSNLFSWLSSLKQAQIELCNKNAIHFYCKPSFFVLSYIYQQQHWRKHENNYNQKHKIRN